MNLFVIVNNDTSRYVTLIGEHSYTNNLAYAATFSSREAANRHGVCGNERIVPVSELLQQPRG